MPGGVHDMGMTAIEYAESLNRQYRQLAEVYDLVAEELDGLIALMKEERGNG